MPGADAQAALQAAVVAQMARAMQPQHAADIVKPRHVADIVRSYETLGLIPGADARAAPEEAAAARAAAAEQEDTTTRAAAEEDDTTSLGAAEQEVGPSADPQQVADVSAPAST